MGHELPPTAQPMNVCSWALSCLLDPTTGKLALGRAMLTQNPTSMALGDVQFLGVMINTRTAARGAQEFPLAASARINLSRVRSETTMRSRWFSFWSAFSRSG